ncbi:GNAT family N-acetyltransferase [Paenibacillus sp. KN14-4R]|uniref:GNAT family N-acetyltransferase n=1 Tax=Paenibacillus sp. KN14-4R TaxID=3445773 RepID=UPI003F9FD7E2
MEIKKIEHISLDQLKRLGEFGYAVNQKYEVTKEEVSNFCSIHMTLQSLDEPYVKQDLVTDQDYDSYKEIVELGFSFGVFVDDQMIGIVISEPQDWNNTLLIWHLHVHEDHRRKSYGKLLLENTVDLAQEHGFRAVTLETQNTNVAAIHFYKQCGFEIEGIDLSLYDTEKIGREEVALFLRKRMV